MKKSLLLITSILLTVIMVVVFFVADTDNVAGERSLGILTPIIDSLSALGDRFSTRGHPWFGYTAAGLVLALLITAISLPKASGGLILFAVIFGIAGQLFLIDQQLWSAVTELFGLTKPAYIPQSDPLHSKVGISIGLGLYMMCLLLCLIAVKGSRTNPIFDIGKESGQTFSARDALILSLVFIVALILRTYALNHIVNGFEGELSPYSAGATSLKGMLLANRGTNGPWAPLGILYYLPIYLTTSLFGTTLHALRLSSVLVGMLTLPLVYLLASRVAGRTAGHVASALFALNCLHIGWSRTDIHPHGVTTWPTLLLCWALINAFDTRKVSWGCVVAFLMGLTWHQYPSGQSAVAIPLLALGMYWLFNRFRLALTWPQNTMVGVGVLLWIVGLPLSYYLADGRWFVKNPFTLTGPRALWGGDVGSSSPLGAAFAVFATAMRQLADVVMGIFYKQPYFFHQEWVPYAFGFNARTVPWIEAPFIAAGFAILLRHIKRFEVVVLLAWLIAGVLPGILSEHAYPKRLSTVFPALDIIAAIAIAYIVSVVISAARPLRQALAVSVVIISLAGYTAFLSNVWFSGRFWKYGEPADINMARQFSESITPGTVVIADLNRGYEGGKYLYLLLDHLASKANRPNVFTVTTNPMMSRLIDQPTEAPRYALDTLAYIWTKLRNHREELASNTEWSKILFV
ncbi:MAG: ArnT family glycosyltransferase, partial [Pseudomonadota bacterium]